MHSTLPLVLIPLALLAACGAVDAPAQPDADRTQEPSADSAPLPAQETVVANAEPDAPEDPMPDSTDPERVEKTDAEWRALLSPEEYRVTRHAGTERAFSGRYWDTKTIGTYRCVCCKTPLFRSDTKFESGCGWPSFFEPLEGSNIIEIEDDTHGMRRTEVRCKKCDAHLGHIFNDGPPPTGLRYCINSVSLIIDPDDKAESSDGE